MQAASCQAVRTQTTAPLGAASVADLAAVEAGAAAGAERTVASGECISLRPRKVRPLRPLWRLRVRRYLHLRIPLLRL